MQVVLRTATLEDCEALYLLYAQLDQGHAEALPEFFRSVEGPVRSREYFAEIIANKDAALFVAEHEGTLVGARERAGRGCFRGVGVQYCCTFPI